MYKSVKRTILNPYGMETKSSVQDLKRPVIIAAFPLAYKDEEVNGYLKCIKENLKMYIDDKNPSLGYFIEDVPFSLTCLSSRDNNSEIDDFLNLIPENNIETAKKMFRNINIYCYCSGNNDALLLMKKFYNKLISLNYRKDEIRTILNEIGILQFVDNLRYPKNGIFPYGTCYTLSDFYDSECNYERHLSNEISDQILTYKADTNPNYNGFRIKSFGEKSLCARCDDGSDHEFKDDYVKQPVINMIASVILITFVNNSINNNISKSESIKIIDKLIIEINKYFEDYISANKKELSDYTKEDLDDLYKFLQEKVLVLISKVYNIKPNDQTKVNNRAREIKQIKYYFEELKYIDDRTRDISCKIRVIKRYANGSLNDVLKVYNGNTPIEIERGTYLANLKNELNLMINKVKSLILKIDSMEISDDEKKILKDEKETNLNFLLNDLDQILVNDDSKHL